MIGSIHKVLALISRSKYLGVRDPQDIRFQALYEAKVLNFRGFIIRQLSFLLGTMAMLSSIDTRASETQTLVLNECAARFYGQSFRSAEDVIKSTPVVPSHPYALQIRAATLDWGSDQVQTYRNHLLSFESKQSQGSPQNIVYPVCKIEPKIDRLLAFSYLSQTDGKVDFFPRLQNENGITQYQKLFPHPALMDVFETEVTAALKQSYKGQRLSWKVWQTMEMDNFALANHRRFEISVSRNGHLIAHATVYDGTKLLLIEEQLFGKVGPPPTRIQVFGMPQGDHMPYLTPAERLLDRLDVKDNPIAKIRTDFPDHSLAEVARLFVKPDLDENDAFVAKKFIFSGVHLILKMIAPNHDLNKMTVVATAGPYGIRHFATEFNMTNIAQYQMADLSNIDVIPDGVHELDGMPFVFRFVPDISSVLDEQLVDPHRQRDIAVFSSTGSAFAKGLANSGYLPAGFPNEGNLLHAKYNTVVDLIGE